MELLASKFNQLREKAESVFNEKHECQDEKELRRIRREAKDLLPQDYFWSTDIDPFWDKPIKYSIAKVSYNSFEKDFLVTVREHLKKRINWNHERTQLLSDFLRINIYKTSKHAWYVYFNRPCPKCGSPMGRSTWEWCECCMKNRREIADDFRKTHTFYCAPECTIYRIEYSDELTRKKGFEGRTFVIKMLDTDEIIKTDNLWSVSKVSKLTEEIKALPRIQFLEN